MTLRRIAALMCLLLAAAGYASFGLALVCGGSMEPSLMPGDVVLYRKGAEARAGDVVVFERSGWPGGVVHRVTRKLPGGAVRTRGDANPIADLHPVPASALRGRCVAVLPSGRMLAFAGGHK